MKEQINYCMTRYPEEIKTLAESPLGGQRFQLFMRRWEMNNEPMPVEVKPEKCVLIVLVLGLVFIVESCYTNLVYLYL